MLTANSARGLALPVVVARAAQVVLVIVDLTHPVATGRGARTIAGPRDALAPPWLDKATRQEEPRRDTAGLLIVRTRNDKLRESR